MYPFIHRYPCVNNFPYPSYCPCQAIYQPFNPYTQPYMGKDSYQSLANEKPLNPYEIMDFGKEPLVIDIEKATENNRTFRTALWTGDYFQITLMNIGVGDDIGLELHPDVDQFLRIEEGEGLVQMGDNKTNLYFRKRAEEDDAIIVPAGMWHSLTNIGNRPLKLYSIYAPAEHPHGTVHQTKKEALEAEEHDY